MPAILLNRFTKAVLLAMLCSAGAANASLLDFKLTGPGTAEWQLNSSVVPDRYTASLFSLSDVAVTYSDTNSASERIQFFNARVGGGLSIYDMKTGNDLLDLGGAQLYTGRESAPTFVTGTFALKGSASNPGKYTLTVTDLDAAPPASNVPEPASAVMLLGGLGLIGAMRKRRQRH